MQFVILRENFLKPLQLAIGVIEKNHAMPILENVLISVRQNKLFLSATNLEVELHGTAVIDQIIQEDSITAPARKLFDICKALPEGNLLNFIFRDQELEITCGKSRFKLLTLPAADFPTVSTITFKNPIVLPAMQLKSLFEAVSFSMGQQDVRYYLNGIFFSISSSSLLAVTIDGHRLSLCKKPFSYDHESVNIIIPRKAILEILRLLTLEEADIEIDITDNHFQIRAEHYRFITKLIDGTYPDYKKVIPRDVIYEIVVDRSQFKQLLTRVSILSNEKYRGVVIYFEPGKLVVEAHNANHEEAYEEFSIDYTGPSVELGFNVTYIFDILNNLPDGNIKLLLNKANNCLQIESEEFKEFVYVVMPMRI